MLLEAGPQRRVPAHHQGRHGLGHPVAEGVGVAEHAGGVADRGPGLDGRVGDDLRHVVPAVLLRRVADHLVPVAGVEVHVDVGHRDPARVEEPLEQQVVADGVHVGDGQAVGHGAAGRAAPARADPDAVVLGVLDQVPHDQEVRAEAHGGDDLELVAEAVGHLGRERLAPALRRPLEGQVAQVVLGGGHPRRQRELRQLGLAELDGDVGPLGDPQRVVAGRGHLAEEVAHLLRRLEVVLVALEVEALRVAHQRAGLDAEQRVVGEVVVAARVVAVVGGQQGRAELPGDLDQLGVGVALGGQPVVLQLDEQAVAAEDVLQAARLLQRPGRIALDERLQHVATEAAGGGDEALVVALQQLPVQAGLVVVALEEGQAGQLDEVAVAGVALGQQGEVVVELAAALRVAPGVVHPAPAGRALRAVVVGHVGLGAEHRRDPLGLAGPVEVEDPVHVAVVRDADGRLPVGRRRRDQVLDPRRAVEHRVLGVDVEVGERVPHEGGSLAVEVVPVELVGCGAWWPRRRGAGTSELHRCALRGYHRAVGTRPPPLRGRCPGAPGRGPASAAAPGPGRA